MNGGGAAVGRKRGYMQLSNLSNLNKPCIYSMHLDKFAYLLWPYANDSTISAKMHERLASDSGRYRPIFRGDTIR